MGHLPIDKLKPAVISLVMIMNAGEKAVSDGIQIFPDMAALLPSLMALPGIHENRKEIVAQALDLESSEIDEIAGEVETSMQFGSAKAKNVTEKALVALAHNLNLILAIQEKEAA